MFWHTHSKHETPHHHPTGKIFAWLTLFACIGDGAFWTVFPLILLAKVGSEQMTGVYSSLIALTVFITSLASAALFTRFSRVHVVKAALVLGIISFVGMTIAENIFHISAFDIPRAVCVALFNICLALFLNSFYKKEEIGAAEGRFFRFNNIGWMIGPPLGGFAAKYLGDESVFLIAGACYAVVLGIFLYQHFVVEHPHLQHAVSTEEHHTSPFTTFVQFFRHPALVLVFFVSLGLEIWWSSGLYRTMQLHSLGWGSEDIGMFVSALVLPLVLLESRIGDWADKKGIPPFILFGFSWLAILVFCVSLFSSSSVMIFAVCMVLAYLGAACIEPLRTAFFFKVVPEGQEEKFYGVYNIAGPTISILGPLLWAFLFSLWGFTLYWTTLACVFFVIAIMFGFATMFRKQQL